MSELGDYLERARFHAGRAEKELEDAGNDRIHTGHFAAATAHASLASFYFCEAMMAVPPTRWPPTPPAE